MKKQKIHVRDIDFFKEAIKPKNWAPKLSQIKRKIGMPISTLHDTFLRYKDRIQLTVEIFPDLGQAAIKDKISYVEAVTWIARNGDKFKAGAFGASELLGDVFGMDKEKTIDDLARARKMLVRMGQ